MIRLIMTNVVILICCIQGRLENFFIGVAIRGPLKILGWLTKNRTSSLIMQLSNIGYMKNMAIKREQK